MGEAGGGGGEGREGGGWEGKGDGRRSERTCLRLLGGLGRHRRGVAGEVR